MTAPEIEADRLELRRLRNEMAAVRLYLAPWGLKDDDGVFGFLRRTNVCDHGNIQEPEDLDERIPT